MKLIHSAKSLAAGDRKVCLAMGFFDGVHLGHQQLIRQTIADAGQHDSIALVLTFDQHPNIIVAPAHVPPLIYSLRQKIRTIESLGSDALLVQRFDREFSLQTGEIFIRGLIRELGRVQSICVGADFVFGHQRSGNVELLKRLGVEMNFAVHGIAAVSLDGSAVRSTRIREAIRNGELDEASQMLGRAYALSGHVVKGDGIGCELGFPTANVDVSGLVLPPDGVYAAHVLMDGHSHQAALNIGLRPTLHEVAPQRVVEAHLLDFSGNLYGQEIEIVPAEKLRDEMKFGSAEELKAQIAADIARAREIF